MADLGFMPDVRRILDMTPSTRQTMLWSATLDGAVNELVRDYLKDPAMHDLVGEVHNGPVEHRFVVQPAMQRLDATVELLETHGPTIMFVKTRFGVDDVTAALMNAGVRAGSLHGARTQQARSRTLEDFKRGKVQVLVATDVAARGIHVDNVELVVHYDLPDNDKDYQHRSGRTGRAGRSGTVVAFVPPSRKRVAQRLVDSLEHEVVWSDGARPNVRTDRPAIEADVRDSREDRPRGNRSFERPGYGDRSGAPRGDRPSYGAPRSDRPSYGERSRDDRPRGDRPAAYGDRPAHGDRPAYGDRNRSERPAYGAPRGDRPAYGDRSGAPRSDRPAYGAPRGDRPAYGADRPAYGDRNRDDRPRGDRPASGERTGAPRSQRPATTGGRPAGPARRPR
jgi:superfamily II DNA/RNA helicase